MELNRRDVMKMGVLGSAALMLPMERFARTELQLVNRIPESELPAPYTVPFAVPPVLKPEFQSANHDYYKLDQIQKKVEILPGKQTTIWGYNGITPGPTIVNEQGRATVVQIGNSLPDVHPDLRYEVWTSTHLHGSCSKPQYDGYASDITPTGCWKDYAYPNIQDARTLWYHDHGISITAPNAYMGLAAQYILHDPLEKQMPIPHGYGKYDLPMILADKIFESNGDFIYDDNSQSGVYGDVILVNGKPWPAMPVERRKYRFRVLNASISRSYDMRLSTGEPLTVIGTDGGLMPKPQPVGHLKVGMAERYEIVIDFSKYKVGQRIELLNDSPPNNRDDTDTISRIMCFDVIGDATDTTNNEIPSDLNPNMNVMGLEEKDSMRTRKFAFERKNGEWTINGTTWADVINSDYEFVLANPGLNDVEIWELENRSGGWFHPIHIHLVDFKILDRNGKAPFDYEKGPKDVVYVGENEVVRVIMRFEHQEGRYMMHCHNLVHEDHDMMGQFRVGTNNVDNDPRHSDPSAKFPARPMRDRKDDPDEDDHSGHGGGGDDRGRDDDHRGRGSSGSGSGSVGANAFVGSSTGGKAKKIVKKKAVKCTPKKVKVKTKVHGKTRTKTVTRCVTPKKAAKKKVVAKKKRG